MQCTNENTNKHGKVKSYNPASAHDNSNSFLFQTEYIFAVKITTPRNYSTRFIILPPINPTPRLYLGVS